MHLLLRFAAAGAALAPLAACGQGGNDAAALVNAAVVRDDAAIRADRLDEKAAALEAQAEQARGAQARAIANEAALDAATAADIIGGAEHDAERIEAK